MKRFAKIMAVLLLALLLVSLLPSLDMPASAATIPVLVLDSTTATASILDHILDFNTYKSGGPFTVTYEWKCNLKPISAAITDVYASVQSIGTTYGTTTDQPESGIRISGNTDWTKVSYTFQNVGTYPMVGSNIPGNVFRFRIHDAKGQLYVKNLVIKNAAGTVLYSLNNDSVVAQLVSEMEASGLTQADMSELGRISFDNCPWMANQFDTGKYTSYVLLETATPVTSSSITRPTTTKPTTAPPTQPPTQPPAPSTTKKPATSKPTVKPTPTPTTIARPTEPPVVTAPPTTEPPTVAPTPAPTPAPTAAPTVPNNPVNNSNQGNSTLVLFVVLGVVVIAMIATTMILVVKSREE